MVNCSQTPASWWSHSGSSLFHNSSQKARSHGRWQPILPWSVLGSPHLCWLVAAIDLILPSVSCDMGWQSNPQGFLHQWTGPELLVGPWMQLKAQKLQLGGLNLGQMAINWIFFWQVPKTSKIFSGAQAWPLQPKCQVAVYHSSKSQRWPTNSDNGSLGCQPLILDPMHKLLNPHWLVLHINATLQVLLGGKATLFRMVTHAIPFQKQFWRNTNPNKHVRSSLSTTVAWLEAPLHPKDHT